MLEKELAMLPFSAKVKALEHAILSSDFQPEDFQWLDIVAQDLSVTIYLHEWRDWDRLFISFLERMTHLGHFERLCLSIEFWQWQDRDAFQFERLASVAAALNGVIQANTNLTCLDLRGSHFYLDWGIYLESLLRLWKSTNYYEPFS